MSRPIRQVPWLDQIGDRWYAYWYDPTTRRTKRVSLHTRDAGEAQSRFAAFLTNQHAFKGRPDAVLSVGEALDHYWTEHVAKNVIDRSRQEVIIHRLKEWFADVALSDVDIPRCREYADARRTGAIGSPAADGTIKREINVLKAAAAHEQRWRRIGSTANPPTPMPSFETPKDTAREAEWLTKAELQRALMLADEPLHDFIMVAYYTAGRRASVEGLTPFQVDLARNRINLRHPSENDNQRRSKKRRPVVPIDPAVRPVVEKLIRANGHTGRLFQRQDHYKVFNALLVGMGLPNKANPHVLRHSRATHLLQDGVPLYDVARLLGDVVTTVERVYGHHCPDYLGHTIAARTT